jgi:HK97 family phage major capsid protein
MAEGTQTNRTAIDLPVDVSQEILQKTQEASAIMQLARPVDLPGRGVAIPVITGDPEAEWVGETDMKPVSNPGLATKIMRPYKLAVIVPFSNEFRRDLARLYDECVRRLPGALALKFDKTVAGAVQAPGTDFDTFANITAQDIGTTNQEYDGLVAADTDIAVHGGILNGWMLAPQGKAALLRAKDGDGRPLFINSVAEGAIPMILGSRAVVSKGAYKAGTPNTVGFAGDWTQAMYGTVEGVQLRFSSDATLGKGDEQINLFQQNMFAVLAEIEVGFRADLTVFNKLTATA